MDQECSNQGPRKTTNFPNRQHCNEDEEGDYMIRIKANSNLSDESTDMIVHLDKDERLRYSFIVKKLLAQCVEISDYKIYAVK